MNLTALRLLTWGTVTGSIACAMWLAAGESALPRFDAPASAGPAPGDPALPDEPTAAGRRAEPDRPSPSSSSPLSPQAARASSP